VRSIAVVMALSLWKAILFILFSIVVAHLLLTIYLSSESKLGYNHEKEMNTLHLKLNSTLDTLHNEFLKLKSRRNYVNKITQTHVSDESSKTESMQNYNNLIPKVLVSDYSKELTGIVKPQLHHPKRKAVIFTMDSISSYEENSRKGGAAGRFIILIVF
jgi:hypothetical protein